MHLQDNANPEEKNAKINICLEEQNYFGPLGPLLLSFVVVVHKQGKCSMEKLCKMMKLQKTFDIVRRTV